jgi:hypothetical protein
VRLLGHRGVALPLPEAEQQEDDEPLDDDEHDDGHVIDEIPQVLDLPGDRTGRTERVQRSVVCAARRRQREQRKHGEQPPEPWPLHRVRA